MSKIVVEKSEIIKIKKLGRDYSVISIAPFSKLKTILPGQFVHVRIPDSNIYFRRAFSIYDVNPKNQSFDLIFKVFGRGTRLLAAMREGETIDILGPLGNSFRLPNHTSTIILAGGGIGMPPVYFLARRLIDKGFEKKRILFFYGGNSKDDLVDTARIRKLGIRIIPSTVDGSVGFKGLITSAIEKELPKIAGQKVIYACGPEGMLKAIDALAIKENIPGQVSLEAPMPCGIGVCLGCIRPKREGGYTRVCREGPVYDIGEVIL